MDDLATSMPDPTISPDPPMPVVSNNEPMLQSHYSDTPAGNNPIVNNNPPAPTQPPVVSSPASQPSQPTTTSPPSDLLDIKQKALAQLTPLVDKLDQNPEDQFHTTMMMIQANDNQDLLPKAYKIAQQITEDKARAQALLDVVNEINYFNQKSNNG